MSVVNPTNSGRKTRSSNKSATNTKMELHDSVAKTDTSILKEETCITGVELTHLKPLMDRGSSSDLITPEGLVHVSPLPNSPTSKRTRAIVTFTPRNSVFDDMSSTNQQFRGFYALLWIAAAVMVIRTLVNSWEKDGVLAGWAYAGFISKDMLQLGISDAILVASTYWTYPFVKLLQHGYLKYYWTGLIIQHVIQFTFLAVAVVWAKSRDWFWVQAGFFVLHALTMLMKMHSYVATNGAMSYLAAELKDVDGRIEEIVKPLGGFKLAEEEALKHVPLPISVTEAGNLQSHMLGQHAQQLQTGLIKAATLMKSSSGSDVRTLRRRVTNNDVLSDSSKAQASGTISPLLTQHSPESPSESCVERHPLSSHPNQELRKLANLSHQLETELTSNVSKTIKWPENLTKYNLFDYMLMPTLVYELDYPRTPSIRPGYVLMKCLASLGTLALLLIITEGTMPYTPQPGQSLFRSCLDLSLPFMANYLLIFYIIFECVCNGFAELTRFADREFYQDWWNATSWDQYSRKWNRPVHTFLLRHVYTASLGTGKMGRNTATFVTFLLSSLVHELVMIVVTKKLRMYLFMLQMAQLPMIFLSRLAVVKRHRTTGNILFWLGLMSGPPMLAVAYFVY